MFVWAQPLHVNIFIKSVQIFKLFEKELYFCERYTFVKYEKL